MARDESRSYDEKRTLTSRRGFAKMLAGGVAGASILSAGAIGDAAAATTVNLGDEGLSTGDVIDDYLSEHLSNGTEVHIPAGEYEWQGSGLDGDYQNAALIGDGEVTFDYSGDYWNANVMAVDGGNFTLRNVTIRGPIESGSNKSRLRFDARHPDSTITLDNFNLPDGDVGQGRAIGIYVGIDHAGTLNMTNCHVEGFPNNGLYAGPYGKSDGGAGGTVTVDHCFFKNNNIDAVRLGGTGDTIQNTVIVQNEVPAYSNGAKSGRGIRIRYPGEDVTVENVHITTSAASPFLVPARSNGPNGTVTDMYIENNTGGTAAFVEAGSFTADNIQVTGSGNQNVTGFDSASNVVTGSNATSPATSLSELDGGSSGNEQPSGTDGTSGNETDSSDSTSGSDSMEHTLTVEGQTSSEKNYYFEASDGVAKGDMINPDDTVNANSVEGTMFGSTDSYEFSGEITEFTSDNLDELTVYVDGSRVDPDSFNSYPNELVVKGSGMSAKDYSFAVSGDLQPGDDINPDDDVSESSVDGAVWWSADHYQFSGDLTELDVSSPDDVVVEVNGTEIDPAEFGSEPLPNRLVVDGTRGDGTASYSFEVTGEVGKSTDLGDLEADDQISGSSVSGQVGNDLDAYRFSGDLESVDIEGLAVMTIEQTR